MRRDGNALRIGSRPTDPDRNHARSCCSRPAVSKYARRPRDAQQTASTVRPVAVDDMRAARWLAVRVEELERLSPRQLRLRAARAILNELGIAFSDIEYAEPVD